MVGVELTFNFPETIEYKKIEIYDSMGSNIRSHFDEAYDFIEDAIENGGTVFVHCVMGMSRSSTIVISYLMRKWRWNAKKAYKYV